MEKDYLIKQWLNNNLTEDEKQTFIQTDDYTFYKDIIDNAEYFKASNQQKVVDFETFKQNYQAKKSSTKAINWYKPLLKIAAILVVAIGVYFTFLFKPLTEVQTLANQKTTVELPDASLVTLNALSDVSFSKSKWDKHREVNLNGEAYFDVEKGKTFDVLTADGVVTVVGTKFNVKQRDSYFEVQCYEGIVKVTSELKVETLLAGDTFRIIGNTITSGKITDIEPQWTKNSSSFDAVPLKEVFAELERQYAISINVNNINVNRLFTGGFEHKNLEKALISITQPMDLTYDIITANKVVINDPKQ
jgi:ferric-dicitrate binding protein FerR (iron transport regulator)